MAGLIKSVPVKGETSLYLREASATPSNAARQYVPPVSASRPVADMPITAHAASTPPPLSGDVLLREALEKKTLEVATLREREQAVLMQEEEARKKGYAEGYLSGEKTGHAEGHEKAREHGAAELDKQLQALAALADSINAGVAAVIGQAEAVIGTIAFEAACKIVGDALATSDGAMAAINEVVAKAKKQEIVGIRISPEDYQRIASYADVGVGAGLQRLRNFGLEADESIELGGAVVYLKSGHIDGRIETQFRVFAQSLKDAVQASQTP